MGIFSVASALILAATIGYRAGRWQADRKLTETAQVLKATSVQIEQYVREFAACREERDMWQRHALAAERIAEEHGVMIPEWSPGQ